LPAFRRAFGAFQTRASTACRIRLDALDAPGYIGIMRKELQPAARTEPAREE
jgi:hypothetical protein